MTQNYSFAISSTLSYAAGSRERYGGNEFSEIEPLEKVKVDIVVARWVRLLPHTKGLRIGSRFR